MVFEPTDPARTMPKWLVFGAIAAVLLLVLVMSWLNEQSWQEPDNGLNDTTAAAPSQAGTQPPLPGPAIGAPAAGPVVITANEPVWIQVYERRAANFRERPSPSGQRYDFPVTATAPLLKTAKAEHCASRSAPRRSDSRAAAPTIRDISLLARSDARSPSPQTLRLPSLPLQQLRRLRSGSPAQNVEAGRPAAATSPQPETQPLRHRS